jgi:hypothetical protein
MDLSTLISLGLRSRSAAACLSSPRSSSTTNAKEVSTGLKFAGFGDACFTVYGDAIKTGNAWTGIDIYGWKIKCSLGDCNYVEFLTALNVDFG